MSIHVIISRSTLEKVGNTFSFGKRWFEIDASQSGFCDVVRLKTHTYSFHFSDCAYLILGQRLWGHGHMHLVDIFKKLCLIWEYESASRKLCKVCHCWLGFLKTRFFMLGWLSSQHHGSFCRTLCLCPQMHSACILAPCLKDTWLY